MRRRLLIGVPLAVAGGFLGHIDTHTALGVVAGAVLGGSLVLDGRAAWVTAAIALLPLQAGAVTLIVPVHLFLAARREDRTGAVVALVALNGLVLFDIYEADESVAPFIILTFAAWFAGRALRDREQIAVRLEERAHELEEEREVHAALSVRYERARIAAELHDIVAHALSVMVVQAAAGQRLAGHDPEATDEVFAAIAGAARQAEGDMGRLLALLGDEDAIGPAPDLALVEELVARAAGSGLDVSLRLEGEREGLPAEIAQLAYSVVQEGLTNALRYAAGAHVSVDVRGEADALVVEVANGSAAADAALAGAGTGTGLQGLRERIGATGGRVEAGPTADGGWTLRARLPRRALVTS